MLGAMNILFSLASLFAKRSFAQVVPMILAVFLYGIQGRQLIYAMI